MRISDWSSDVCSSDLAERKNTLPTFLPTSTNIHMRLWIAEKPDAGRQIAKALGGGNESGGHIKLAGGDIVTWAIGHLIDDFLPHDYDPAYQNWDLSHITILPQKFHTNTAGDKTNQSQIE